jgi:5'-nucleotidase
MTLPRILLANDDGIQAPGITALAQALESVAEVWVVAPDREQSATSHAISLHKPLRARQIEPRCFAVDGTPADCVYLGLHHFLPDPPAIVVSGVNHGPNLGNDVIYSGTVSAAMEGALFGYAAVAVSLCLPDNYRGQDLAVEDFAMAVDFARDLIQTVLANPMPPGVLLNVNVPFLPRDQIRGYQLCRLGYTDWAEAVTVRKDPRGRPYYWIGGQREATDVIAGSDINAVANGIVSVTPIHYDATDYRSLGYARSLALAGYRRQEDDLGDAQLPHPPHPKAQGPLR